MIKNKTVLHRDKQFIIYKKKANDTYKTIAKDYETKFDASNYELERPLPKVKK